MKSKELTGKIIGCAMKVHSALGNGFQEVISDKLRRNFAEASHEMSADVNMNLEVVANNYGLLINYLALETEFTSLELRRKLGKNSKEFLETFGVKRAILLYLIALDSKTSANSASVYLGLSPRSVQTYFNDLKETVQIKVVIGKLN